MCSLPPSGAGPSLQVAPVSPEAWQGSPMHPSISLQVPPLSGVGSSPAEGAGPGAVTEAGAGAEADASAGADASSAGGPDAEASASSAGADAEADTLNRKASFISLARTPSSGHSQQLLCFSPALLG